MARQAVSQALLLERLWAGPQVATALLAVEFQAAALNHSAVACSVEVRARSAALLMAERRVPARCLGPLWSLPLQTHRSQ